MRLSGNFHLEWGYLTPVPSVMRTARIVAVATAIGATAGAAVVLSLADRPAPVMAAGAGQSLVVVHSLVQPAEASVPAAPAAPVASIMPAPEPVAAAMPAPAPVVAAVPPGPVQAKLQISAPPLVQASVPAVPSSVPPSVTASTENPPVVPSAVSEPTVADAAPVAPEPSAAQAAVAKKPHVNVHDATRPPLAVAAAPKRKPADNGLAPILRRLFSAQTGNTRAN